VTPDHPPLRPVVVDTGIGNLGNVARALRRLGAEPEVTADPARVAGAGCLLLPGVGAFAPPRAALRGPLEEALAAALAGGAWLLGICVGFQLLFEASEEFGTTDGLALLPGRVTRLPESVPLPHIGWNRLEPMPGTADHPLLSGLAGAYVYFVHSFAPEGLPAGLCLARTTHGRSFPAAAALGRVLGVQFHPERSGEAGLRLLANYLALASAPATVRVAGGEAWS
jgi:glutamine amidotransferase